jgi:mRNA interferase RelE/StbE
MHPDLKRKTRASLKTILADPSSGKALKDELAGLRSFGAGTFRAIYRVARNVVEIVAIGPRERIYEETYRRLKRETR